MARSLVYLACLLIVWFSGNAQRKSINEKIPAGIAGQHYSFPEQLWINADSAFPGLPASVQVYRTESLLHGRPHIAWYLKAPLHGGELEFITDTTTRRRLTPQQFYARNGHPVAVVNGTFFSFEDNRNLNVVISKGKMLARNIASVKVKGVAYEADKDMSSLRTNSTSALIKDSLRFAFVSRAAFGIDQKGRPDAAWIFTDSSKPHAMAFERFPLNSRGFGSVPDVQKMRKRYRQDSGSLKKAGIQKRWKMETAIGGGPMLVQDGHVMITNNEERMFMGKAVDDLHPRTAIGYTRDGFLIILVVQGRFKGIAEGASLRDLAEIMIGLGAVEALNLDGGGSSCLLVQGKETIQPSDKTGQRTVPAVFIIRNKK